MGSGNEWDDDCRYIEKAIDYWTRRIINDLDLSPDAMPDIKQELRLDLVHRLPSFNPKKASRRTFISLLLKNKIETLRESLTAAKRDFRKVLFSYDDEIEGGDGGSVCRIELLSSDNYHRDVYQRFLPNAHLLELTIDLRTILPNLTAQQRHICQLFADGHSKTNVAEALGIARPTLYDRLEVLRQRFSEFGYKK